MAETGTFLGELQRGWQRFWGLSWWWKGPIIAGVAVIVVIIIAAVASGDDEDTSDAEVRATATSTPTERAETEVPSETETPTPTEEPTPEPTPTPTSEPTPTPVPSPVVLEGVGLTATETVSPPSAISIVTLTHNGSSNFIVRSIQRSEENLLVNEIGSYSGRRPLFGSDPVLFDIDADGAWRITLEAIGSAPSAPFSGTGDDVSGLFEPPSAGGWNVSHNGSSNFIVRVHCAGGSDLVVNEIGPVDGSTVVRFDDGPCLWEVQADGNWNLSPQ